MKQHLIYINLDGFGRYYYDTLHDKDKLLPNFARLLQHSTFLDDLHTGVPSITFPMQCAIVSGCYSQQTGNCFASLDRKHNRMVWHRRRNDAQNVAELFAEQGMTTLSIQQFSFENRGCTADDPDHLYIQPGGNCHVRFPILLELLETTEPDALPNGIFLYADDLDGIGHNPPACYAHNEGKRVSNVQQRLGEIDAYIGSLLDLMDSRGLWASTYLVVTTDHGMISYRGSKTKTLRKALLNYGFGTVEIHPDNAELTHMPDVLMTGHSIQAQLYFKNPPNDPQALKQYLLGLRCVESVLTADELAALGVAPYYADMVVSPAEGESFCPTGTTPSILYASHDSLHQKCNHIFGTLAGPGIKQGYLHSERTYNIQLIPTVLEAMRLPPLRNATALAIRDTFTD